MGFVQIYPVFSSVSCKKDYILNDLFVSKEFRKKGVATALLERAKEFSNNNDGKGLALETAKDNHSAKRLYEKLGWHIDKQYDSYYWKVNHNPFVKTRFINPEVGYGVFAKKDINKDDRILTGKALYKTKNRDHKTLQINEIEHSRLDVPFENTNHSCNPNAGVKENSFDGYDLIALRKILKGEQITMDYCMTEWESILGKCNCGSNNCRGFVTGAKDLSEDIFRKYRGYVAKYIKQKKLIY